MKKKYLFISIICVVIVLLSGIVLIAKNSIDFSIGTCIVADNGSYLVVFDNSPVVMSQRSGKDSLFSELETGNRIFVIHDGIAESYPGKTGVYFVWKLSDGQTSDVPKEVVKSLTELGWLKK